MSNADEIRAYVVKIYIAPARIAGESEVSFTSGSIHKALKYDRRYRAVCSAIDAEVFEKENRLTRLNRSDQKEGAHVTWTFSL